MKCGRLSLTASILFKVLSRQCQPGLQINSEFGKVQNILEIYLLLRDACHMKEATFSYVPLLNMLVVINSKALTC